MKIYIKIIIFIEALLTVFYSLVVLAGSKNITDDILVLVGALLVLFIVPYFIAYIITFVLAQLGFAFIAIKGRKKVMWKIFLILYPIILMLSLIGNLTK